MLRWSVEALLQAGAEEVVVVVSSGAEGEAHKALAGLRAWRTVRGGASRADSVRNGLEALGGADDRPVLIHDAARPFLSEAVIRRTIEALSDADGALPAGVAAWLRTVRDAVATTARDAPLMFYGTDWLAFGHFVIGLAFVGALRDPVRNRWLYEFGMIACALVPLWALVFGHVRGIPLWWRALDAAFDHHRRKDGVGRERDAAWAERGEDGERQRFQWKAG